MTTPLDRQSCFQRVDEQKDERRMRRRWHVAETRTSTVRCSAPPDSLETR